MNTLEFNLEHFLPYKLSLISNRISQGIAVTYEKHYQLRVQEWRVIAILGRYPGSSATEIINYTAMDKVTVSRAVKRLLGRALIIRSEDESDRRRMHLQLTAQGDAIYHSIIPAALDYEKQLMQQFDPADQQLLDRLIKKLDNAVSKVKPLAG